MFEDLSLKLRIQLLKKVSGQGKLTEKNISDTLREIRRILLDADVNYKVAKDFIDKCFCQSSRYRSYYIYYSRAVNYKNNF